MSYFLVAYNALRSIYSEGKYISDVVGNIPDNDDKSLVVRIVYGVVERDVELNYYISKLVRKSPKSAIKLVLKIGLYCLKYMDALPNYSVCDNTVKLVKDIKKSSLAGFVNATLKSSINKQIELPENETERLSVISSTPLWITKKIIKQYKDTAKTILFNKPTTKTHVRHNSVKWNAVEFESRFKGYEFSEVGGVYVRPTDDIKQLFKSGKITYQSPQSIKIAQMALKSNPKKILDVCSAPGGKSVYMAERSGCKVTAFDVHPHRVELIKKYSERMGVEVDAHVQDATVYLSKYAEIYDVVLVDVPCSGIGVRYSKPDVLLNREEKDIPELVKVQEAILETSARYVKVGGEVVYSTCTIFEEENERVIDKFVNAHPEFNIVSTMKSVPGINGDEGFFAVRLRRNI